MYIGRIVCVAMTDDGRLCAAYRVSSRSFPNRTAMVKQDVVSIVPKPGHEGDIHKSPYIAYNCVRVVCGRQVAVVTNGSHTDAIAEKIESGMSPRDALVLSSIVMDYEKDAYSTPRISAVIDQRNRTGWLGTVREDGLEVCRMALNPGTFFYTATYEENGITSSQAGHFFSGSAAEACDFVLGKDIFAQRSNPVTAVAAMAIPEGFELAAKDAK